MFRAASRKSASSWRARLGRKIRWRWISTFPASIFEMSRTSLMRPSSSFAFRWTRSRLSRCCAFRFPCPPLSSAPVKPRMTVIGVRSSWETEARNRSFSADARWSSRFARAIRLRWSSSSSFCSASRRVCSATRSFAAALATATARLGAIAARTLRAFVREGLSGAEGEHPDDVVEVDERNMDALAGQDAAVEDVDRGRLRVDRHEDRLLFGSRPPRLLGADSVLRRASSPATARACRRPPAAAGKGRRDDAPDTGDQGLEDFRSESLQVVHRRGDREHVVDRGLDVALGEGPRARSVNGGGAIELPSELADLVARSLEERGGLPVGGEVFERPGRGHGGRQDVTVHVGQEPDEPGEDERREDHERSGRGVAAPRPGVPPRWTRPARTGCRDRGGSRAATPPRARRRRRGPAAPRRGFRAPIARSNGPRLSSRSPRTPPPARSAPRELSVRTRRRIAPSAPRRVVRLA